MATSNEITTDAQRANAEAVSAGVRVTNNVVPYQEFITNRTSLMFKSSSSVQKVAYLNGLLTFKDAATLDSAIQKMHRNGPWVSVVRLIESVTPVVLRDANSEDVSIYDVENNVYHVLPEEPCKLLRSGSFRNFLPFIYVDNWSFPKEELAFCDPLTIIWEAADSANVDVTIIAITFNGKLEGVTDETAT